MLNSLTTDSAIPPSSAASSAASSTAPVTSHNLLIQIFCKVSGGGIEAAAEELMASRFFFNPPECPQLNQRLEEACDRLRGVKFPHLLQMPRKLKRPNDLPFALMLCSKEAGLTDEELLECTHQEVFLQDVSLHPRLFSLLFPPEVRAFLSRLSEASDFEESPLSKTWQEAFPEYRADREWVHATRVYAHTFANQEASDWSFDLAVHALNADEGLHTIDLDLLPRFPSDTKRANQRAESRFTSPPSFHSMYRFLIQIENSKKVHRFLTDPDPSPKLVEAVSLLRNVASIEATGEAEQQLVATLKELGLPDNSPPDLTSCALRIAYRLKALSAIDLFNLMMKIHEPSEGNSYTHLETVLKTHWRDFPDRVFDGLSLRKERESRTLGLNSVSDSHAHHSYILLFRWYRSVFRRISPTTPFTVEMFDDRKINWLSGPPLHYLQAPAISWMQIHHINDLAPSPVCPEFLKLLNEKSEVRQIIAALPELWRLPQERLDQLLPAWRQIYPDQPDMPLGWALLIELFHCDQEEVERYLTEIATDLRSSHPPMQTAPERSVTPKSWASSRLIEETFEEILTEAYCQALRNSGELDRFDPVNELLIKRSLFAADDPKIEPKLAEAFRRLIVALPQLQLTERNYPASTASESLAKLRRSERQEKESLCRWIERAMALEPESVLYSDRGSAQDCVQNLLAYLVAESYTTFNRDQPHPEDQEALAILAELWPLDTPPTSDTDEIVQALLMEPFDGRLSQATRGALLTHYVRTEPTLLHLHVVSKFRHWPVQQRSRLIFHTNYMGLMRRLVDATYPHASRELEVIHRPLPPMKVGSTQDPTIQVRDVIGRTVIDTCGKAYKFRKEEEDPRELIREGQMQRVLRALADRGILRCEYPTGHRCYRVTQVPEEISSRIAAQQVKIDTQNPFVLEYQPFEEYLVYANSKSVSDADFVSGYQRYLGEVARHIALGMQPNLAGLFHNNSDHPRRYLVMAGMLARGLEGQAAGRLDNALNGAFDFPNLSVRGPRDPKDHRPFSQLGDKTFASDLDFDTDHLPTQLQRLRVNALSELLLVQAAMIATRLAKQGRINWKDEELRESVAHWLRESTLCILSGYTGLEQQEVEAWLKPFEKGEEGTSGLDWNLCAVELLFWSDTDPERGYPRWIQSRTLPKELNAHPGYSAIRPHLWSNTRKEDAVPTIGTEEGALDWGGFNRDLGLFALEDVFWTMPFALPLAEGARGKR